MFYLVSLLASVLTLSLWYFTQKWSTISAGFRNLFFIALGAYGLSMVFASGGFEAKWPILARDLGLIAIAPAVLSMFSNKKSVFFFLLAGVAVATTWIGKTTSFGEASLNAENEWELLVEISAGKDQSVLKDVVEQFDLLLEPAFAMERTGDTELDDFYAVEIPEHNEPKLSEILTALQQVKGVDWVEDNETVTVAPIESRKLPSINKKYGLNDPDLSNQWAYASLEVNRLYDVLRETAGNPKKVASIYILDTGIDAKHEDLKGQFFSTKSAYDRDVRGHGTHCAGIAAAVSNNGKGVASLAPDKSYVNVTSVKVLSDMGIGNQRMIINGILEAADAGADVISMSLGGISNRSRQRAYAQAVQYARDAGSIVVVAAGNDGGNAIDIAPANVTGVITIAAVDTLLNRASFSNSVERIDMGLSAPGVAIYSTLPNNKYGALSGTSMATPFVAGLIGVMRSFHPELTTDEAYAILHESGKITNTPKTTGRLVQPDVALLLLLDTF